MSNKKEMESRRVRSYTDSGLCPNGCGPLDAPKGVPGWDGRRHVRECPACHFGNVIDCDPSPAPPAPQGQLADELQAEAGDMTDAQLGSLCFAHLPDIIAALRAAAPNAAADRAAMPTATAPPVCGAQSDGSILRCNLPKGHSGDHYTEGVLGGLSWCDAPTAAAAVAPAPQPRQQTFEEWLQQNYPGSDKHHPLNSFARAAWDAAVAAANAGGNDGSNDEVCWLIERGQAVNHSPTLWWCGGDQRAGVGEDEMKNWTTDVSKARRFATKWSASRLAAELFGRGTWTVTEHVFVASGLRPAAREAGEAPA